MLVPSIFAQSVFDQFTADKRPDGYYCKEDSDCESLRCVANTCSNIGRRYSPNIDEGLALIKENAYVLRNAVIVLVTVMILYYLKQEKVILR